MRFICNFWGVSSCVFVAIHRVLKNKCDLFFVFLSVCTTLAAVEYHSRTREACSAHRVPLKMRRVPQEPVFCTARIFRTTGGLLRYRMSRMPKMPGKKVSSPHGTIGKFHSGTAEIKNNSLSWTGNSQNVTLTISGTVSFNTISVTYE